MAKLAPFNEKQCPKCDIAAFAPLDDVFALMNLAPAFRTEVRSPYVSDFEVYVKVCRNCGYSETYSRVLVDEIRRQEHAGGFGAIAHSGGEYILSIYVTYEHNGETVHDFSIPFSTKQMMHLYLSAATCSDDDLLGLVFHGPYRRAWDERVKDKPGELATQLRQLIRSSKG